MMDVGGPALTTNNDLTGYRESLLAYIRANHVPLDFYSIHHYTVFSEDPLDFVRLADQYRQLLDSYGFTHTAIQLTEWNYGLVDNPTDAQRAASPALAWIDMKIEMRREFSTAQRQTVRTALTFGARSLTSRGRLRGDR